MKSKAAITAERKSFFTVTSDEMIPETHTHGYQKQATYALLLEFIAMIIMERLF